MNGLQANSHETEYLLFHTKDEFKGTPGNHINVLNDSEPFSQKCKKNNLRIYFDEQLSMKSHINNLYQHIFLNSPG